MADSSLVVDAQPRLRQAPPPEEAYPEAGTVEGRLADAMLETRVLLALADDNLVSHYPFQVEVRTGRVFVWGTVNSNAHRERVDAVARDIDGVQLVVNEVESLEPDVTVAEAVPEGAAAEADPTSPPEPVAAPAEVWHTVRSGESLWTISRQHGTSVQNIQRLNNLGSGSIRPGQRLRVR